MRALDYALREGWKGLRRSGTAGLLATAAIGLAMLVLGTTVLFTSNLERLIAQWSSAAEFSVFLTDAATSEQRGVIEAEIDRSGISAGRTYLSKADALSRFRREFTDLSDLVDTVGDNPFPASIEVRLQPNAERDDRVLGVSRRMAGMPGVADVRYDREWLSRLATVLRAVRSIGWGLALIVSLAAVATVASVVRLGLQSRWQEIEIMQLVGSPVAFIQGPFIAEGLLQGGIGAVAAILLLWAGFLAAMRSWGGAVSAILDGGDLRFLSARLLIVLIFGGMVVGAVGGFAASRHAR